MYKLVVLCAFLALAAAKPDLLVAAPLATQYSTYISPASTTITKQASSVIHPSPLVYSSPLELTHFIKKRSPQFPLGLISPTTYISSSPLAATYTSPLVHSASLIPAWSTAHLIKKRSAPLLSTSYLAPTSYTAPLVTSYAATSPLIASTPLISSPSWISHSVGLTHLIKKRSPQFLTSYLAPTAVSHQARVDLQSAPFVTSYTSPLAYSSPIALSHVI